MTGSERAILRNSDRERKLFSRAVTRREREPYCRAVTRGGERAILQRSDRGRASYTAEQ